MIKLISKNKKTGFTLIEAMIALAIFIFALGAVSGFLIYSYRAQKFSLAQALVTESARQGVKQLTKELREAIQSDSGQYLLESAQDFEVIFYSDIDQDDQVERIRYFLENEQLKKGVINPSGQPIDYSGPEQVKTISSYLKNTSSTPLFYFYDQTYAGQETDLPLDSPVPGDILDEISLVGIKMAIDVNPGRAPEILNIESKIQLRNTKQNEN
jgi:prepilin-type N-terminal cleavage/methylation domain-containing protein